MLSRCAERLYWLGRYIERTEDTARLLNAFSQVMLDLPKSRKLGWESLLKIMSVETEFHEHYDKVSEDNVIDFLLVNPDNPGSIRSAVKSARENARTSRDLIPLEGWEMINDLYLVSKKTANTAIRRRDRFRFLSDVIGRCQQFNGMIQSTLSRNQAHDFLSLGSFIERADMTSRTLDVAAGILLSRDESHKGLDNVIWMEILKAQNAVMMYRVANGPRISPKAVLRFVLCNDDFPRSIKYCLGRVRTISENLPRNEAFIEASQALTTELDAYKGQDVISDGLREFFDEIQQGMNNLHNVIAETWLYPTIEAVDAPETASQSQSQTA